MPLVALFPARLTLITTCRNVLIQGIHLSAAGQVNMKGDLIKGKTRIHTPASSLPSGHVTNDASY